MASTWESDYAHGGEFHDGWGCDICHPLPRLEDRDNEDLVSLGGLEISEQYSDISIIREIDRCSFVVADHILSGTDSCNYWNDRAKILFEALSA